MPLSFWGFMWPLSCSPLKVRRFNMALAALAVSAMLAVALVLQATVSERIAGWAALLLTTGVVMFGLTVQLGSWLGGGDAEADGDTDFG